MVTGSADIAIIARGLVEKVEAPGLGIARIMGARVLIVARQQARRQALPIAAVVAQGAGIVVITLPRHGLVQTKPLGGTTVHGTRVAIIAQDSGTGNTDAFGAIVIDCARVPIITGSGKNAMDATYRRVTAILGARVLIIAIGRFAPLANPLTAGVPQGAGIAVITRPCGGLIETPRCWRTTISSTPITIVAHQRVASHTGPIDTAITNGTGIPILAGRKIGNMQATALGVTRVIGADIVIGTV
jgi:hypothetical protein